MHVPRRQAIRHGKSRKGPWHMAKTIASGVGMTNDWLASQGVLSLKTLWAELAHLRGTAAALLCVEPTRPDPHARWCREGARKRASLPDFCLVI
ncbi:MAG: hypothetical protein ACK41S_11145 [Planctomycetota bacterium]|jgi:hypothetical protein